MTRLLVLFCLSLPLIGCQPSPENTRQMTVDRERASFVYQVAPQQIYDEARALLAERGHSLPTGKAVVDTSIASDWRRDGYGEKRFLLRIIRVDDDHHLVHIIGQSRDSEGEIYFRARWDDLEWELIQRLEPGRALAIADKANRHADDVHRRNTRKRTRW